MVVAPYRSWAKVIAPLLVALMMTGVLAKYYSYFQPKWRPTYPYYLSGNPLMKPIEAPPGSEAMGPGAQGRVNATLLSLVRNNELNDLLGTMKEVEKTFNSKFNYPWTFLNDEPFTAEFRMKTKELTKAQVNYEVIPKEHWNEPKWINKGLEKASAEYLNEEGVQYSSLESYHRMCRWNSGMFVHHPKLQEYRWYWRVEPKTHYFCDVDYDVFRYMEENNKTYGFVINIYDSPESVRTLWPVTLEFVADHPEYVHENSAIGWLTHETRKESHNDITGGYSTCHFWSNFEIGDMDFWRSEVYQQYFDHLDRAGGFFYERWGDAPVHSLALGLFVDKTKIHWFKDIGYQHIPYFNCPNTAKCSNCIPGLFSDGTSLSQENCMPEWLKYGNNES